MPYYHPRVTGILALTVPANYPGAPCDFGNYWSLDLVFDHNSGQLHNHLSMINATKMYKLQLNISICIFCHYICVKYSGPNPPLYKTFAPRFYKTFAPRFYNFTIIQFVPRFYNLLHDFTICSTILQFAPAQLTN